MTAATARRPMTRQDSLVALTEADMFEICVALTSRIEQMKDHIKSGDIRYWQPRIDAAEAAMDRVIAIRAAS